MNLFSESTKMYTFAFLLFNLLFIPCYQDESMNVCKIKPCHKGICVSTSIPPRYKCLCHGTRYYGPRCQQKCPKFNDYSRSGKRVSSMPIECIEI